MITRPFTGQAQVCFILFASFALAALQNVTVDDAATTGTVIPTYLPLSSSWNIGNNCSGCLVQPDPSFAYDGTWHDTTFSPNSTVSQALEFTFVGSGLYIFFILANSVPYATTLTNVNFILDGVQVSAFLHKPSTSTNYEYNQAVYANDSIPYDQHTMMVAPVNDSVNNVLILFDYLIYTTDPSVTSIVTVNPTYVATTLSGSPTSTGISTASSGQNIGAIVGGIVTGVGTLVVTAALLCYRRYKRRTGIQSFPAQMTVVEPFAVSHQTLPTSPGDNYVTHQQISTGSESAITQQPGSRRKTTTSPSTAQPSNLASTATQSSGGASSGGATEILVQVGQLRDEVARLRRLQDQSWHIADLGSEPPPEYS